MLFEAIELGPTAQRPYQVEARGEPSPSCSFDRIEKRIAENHKVPLTYDKGVVKLTAERCTELENGGRMIDAILTNTVLPKISSEFLTRMVEGKPVERVHVGVEGGEFSYGFE